MPNIQAARIYALQSADSVFFFRRKYNSYHTEVGVCSFFQVHCAQQTWKTNEILYEGELSTLHKNEKTSFHDDRYLVSKTTGSGSDSCGFKRISTLLLVSIQYILHDSATVALSRAKSRAQDTETRLLEATALNTSQHAVT